MNITAYYDRLDAIEAAIDYFDREFPDWQDRERFGDTIVSEDDFPLYDDSVDEGRVPNEDWEAMAEALWADPAERF